MPTKNSNNVNKNVNNVNYRLDVFVSHEFNQGFLSGKLKRKSEYATTSSADKSFVVVAAADHF
jgi:hypothetical protein